MMMVSKLLLLLVAMVQAVTCSTRSRSDDAAALMPLKSRVPPEHLSSHFIATNWSDSSSVCDWIGVACSPRHGRVSALSLPDTGLHGSLPPELGNLTFLVSLNLAHNSFHGELPENWSRLRRLKFLILSNNLLTGQIPYWLGYLPQLRQLHLRNNAFNGLIPSTITNVSKLELLELSNNHIQGGIPQEIGNLQELRQLGLQQNRFEGELPMSVFNLSNLRVLALGSNRLSGYVPEDLCVAMPNIEKLYLSSNKLEGKIPTNCSQLRVLYLSENNIHDSIPQDIDTSPVLEYFLLRGNSINGTIPTTIGNLSLLKMLDLSYNTLTGTVPEEIGHLRQLQSIDLSFNRLGGWFPMSISNITSLTSIQLTSNSFSGRLPSTFGSGLPNLSLLFLGSNALSGEIPRYISNCSLLSHIDMGNNSFSGIVPDELGELRLLKNLTLGANCLVSGSSELSFIDSLSKCRDLGLLDLRNNPFAGTIPNSVGNLSSNLEQFHCALCRLRGAIPEELGNLTNLRVLDLQFNQLSGSIPSTLGNLRKVEGLYLNLNSLSGAIPGALCSLEECFEMYLHQNQLRGSIPTCFGNLKALRKLWISRNCLESSIPESLWELHDVLELNLSANLLSGPLSTHIGNLKQAYLFDLSNNQLSGSIPNSVGDMQQLLTLALSYNRIEGSIPKAMGDIPILKILDLSHNDLFGSIPLELQNLSSLLYFDVSFNNLSGRIPSSGPFSHFTSASFTENPRLCGDSQFGVHPCKKAPPLFLKRVIIPYAAGLLAFIILLVAVYLLASRISVKRGATTEQGPDLGTMAIKASYYDLIKATDHWSDSNFLGRGGFGSVFKAVLGNGVFAVKVFNVQTQGAFKSFEVECKILNNLRHRNLCRIFSVCSNMELKALIMEYMSNGDLNQWLHSETRSMTARQRLAVMIDVASALEYLHHGYSTPIAHLDLKPSNILIDDQMVGHLSDFGIAKLFDDASCFSHTQTLSTLGYIAPEYASDGLITPLCDVYSYGIVLMEVFTGVKPASTKFEGDSCMVNWVKRHYLQAVDSIVDRRFLDIRKTTSWQLVCFSSIFDVALKCSANNPKERMSMTDVVAALKSIQRSL